SEEGRVEVVPVPVRNQAKTVGGLRLLGEVVGHVPERAGLVGVVGVEGGLPVGDREGHVADEAGGEKDGRLGEGERGGNQVGDDERDRRRTVVGAAFVAAPCGMTDAADAASWGGGDKPRPYDGAGRVATHCVIPTSFRMNA